MKRKYSKEEVWQWIADNCQQFIYINKEDLNIFIRKRHGISWTMNFGNPRTWIIIGGVISILAFLMFLVK